MGRTVAVIQSNRETWLHPITTKSTHCAQSAANDLRDKFQYRDVKNLNRSADILSAITRHKTCLVKQKPVEILVIYVVVILTHLVGTVGFLL